MRRYYFRFTFPGDGETVAFTTNAEHAQKITKHQWTTNASTYLTPPLTRVEFPDTPALRLDLDDRVYRVNLVRVREIESWVQDAGN